MLYVLLPALLGIGFSYISMMYIVGLFKGRHWPVVAGASESVVTVEEEGQPMHKLLIWADRLSELIMTVCMWVLKGFELYIWFLIWQIPLAYVEEAVAVGSVEHIIGWSMGLGFAVCAICIRVAHHLDGVTDKLLRWTQPLYYRLFSYATQQFNRITAPLVAPLLQRLGAMDEPPLLRWQEIVAQYGPLTDAEEAARKRAIRFALFCVVCILVVLMPSTLVVVVSSFNLIAIRMMLGLTPYFWDFFATVVAWLVALAASMYIAIQPVKAKHKVLEQIKARHDDG